MRLLRRPLLLGLCFAIVAAFQGRPAASVAVSEDVPVPAGTAAVARALGIETVPDRGRFVAELTRLVHEVPERRDISVTAVLPLLNQQPATELVPLPLTAAVWSDAVFHRRVAPEDLLFAILSDRQAALVCHGLAALDDDTLEYFATHASLVARLYERSAAAFGVFAGHLHIRGDLVTPPGGAAAAPLWEAVVGETVTHPDLFVIALFTQAEGRTAYLYDTIGQLDSARTAFALGLWMKDSATRLDAMKALAKAWTGAFREWRLKTEPFARQAHDPAAMLMRVRTDATGAPTFPSSRGLWSRVFESAGLPDDPARLLKTASDDRPFDAAWLVKAAGDGDADQRLDRLDQVAFGQRAFASVPATEMPDVFVALCALPRYRMLMLTLERMGITKAATYGSAARLAGRLSSLDGGRTFAATVQFQGVLALLWRMTAVGTIDAAKAEALVTDVVAVPLNADGRYAGAIARWLDQKLRPVIPRVDTFETSLIEALSGPPPGAAAPRVRWEGRQYRLDLTASERRRLEGVRAKQRGFPIDVVLDVADAAQTLTSTSVTLAQVESIGARLKSVVNALPPTPKSAGADPFPPGIEPPKGTRDAINKAVDELGRIASTKDVKRTTRVGSALAETTDDLTAQALMALAYAINLGDPDGAVLLAGDVSWRHDFGFGVKDTKQRLRAPWALPRHDIRPGATAWHVRGSLLGLDVALAPLELRRLSADRVFEEPVLTSGERDAFAESYALMNAFALDDTTRDAIENAIDDGRHRVAALGGDPEAFDALADEIGMDGWRRRAVRWTLAHEPDHVESMFSLSELVVLGDLSREIDLHQWGMSAIPLSGCVCTEMLPPGRWPSLAGRPQLGVLAMAVSDLNLHVARMLKQLGLPARLAKSVLGAAVQDFIDEVRPTDPDDWLTLVRTAQAVARERIEDYVAAATAPDGPLVPDWSR